MALYNNAGKQIPKDVKGILNSTKTLYSLKELTVDCFKHCLSLSIADHPGLN